MIKIMFVCHGNICRSPMAELILKKMVKDANITDKISVSSCATSTEEIWHGVGNPIYPPAKALLESKGYNCLGKRAVQVTKADYNKYDMFICMDDKNIRNLMYIFGKDPENKVSKLNPADVFDPWYSRDFDTAYNEIYSGCENLLKKLNVF